MAKTVTIDEATFEVLSDLVNYNHYRSKKAIIDEAINILYLKNRSDEKMIEIIRTKHFDYENALDNKYGKEN